MASLTGKTLGKYQIAERLGRGGMAEVYKAYHPQLERYAAVKVLHGYLAEGQDFLGRFQREAKAIAALRHPNIVQIYDIDIQDEHYFMVMEFIDGDHKEDRDCVVREKLMDLIKNLKKRFSCRDIAILTRGNKEIKMITDWLLKANIPVESEYTLDVKENHLIGELVAFLQQKHKSVGKRV